MDFDIDAVFIQVTLAQLSDHVEVVLVDVGKSNIAVAEFWN